MDFKDRTDLPEGIIKAIEEFERIKDDPNLQMEALSKQIARMDYTCLFFCHNALS